MELQSLTDEALIDELHTSQAEIIKYGVDDSAGRHAAWEKVIEGMRELERRYPPVTVA